MTQKKVLVIDDNPVVVRMNESLLKSAGYDVITALDGEEGFRKACEEKPAVILLDLILPKMHGFELCQRLKQDPQTAQVPVIIVTGTGLDEIVQREPEIGADGFLAKPYSLEQLEGAINKALDLEKA